MEGQEPKTYHTKLDSSGRIVIPAEVRQRKKLTEGDTVVVVDDDQGLHVKTLAQAIAEAQAYFCAGIPEDVSLVDQLIAERREEAKRE
jgi:AbrB family looped-hinge helix DNA binding protein